MVLVLTQILLKVSVSYLFAYSHRLGIVTVSYIETLSHSIMSYYANETDMNYPLMCISQVKIVHHICRLCQ